MGTNNQKTITIILFSIFILLFLTGLFLFISSILSRRNVNKIELPSLEELDPAFESDVDLVKVNDKPSESFYFEEDDDDMIILADDNSYIEPSVNTRRDYKNSKKSKVFGKK